jgi:hypothetical protein
VLHCHFDSKAFPPPLTCIRATSSVILRSASQHAKSALMALWPSTRSTWKASRRSKLSNLAGETLFHPTTRALRPRSRRRHRPRNRDLPSHHPSTTSHPPLTTTKTSSRQRRRLQYRTLHIIRQCMRTGYKQEWPDMAVSGRNREPHCTRIICGCPNFCAVENEMTSLMTKWSNYCIREFAPFPPPP